MAKVHELKIERSKVVDQMTALNTKAKDEKRDFNTEENQQWDRMYAEHKSLGEQISREEFLESQQRSDAQKQIDAGKTPPANKKTKDEQAAQARSVIAKYLKGSIHSLNAEERSIAAATGLISEASLLEQRDTQLAGGAGVGAEFVKEEYLNEFERHMKYFGGMQEASRIIRTTTGGQIPYPTVKDQDNEGHILGEAQTESDQVIPTGFVNIGAFKYSSKAIKVPVELIQDDGFGLVSEIPSLAAERVARISNRHFTTGDGNNKPAGVLTDAGASGFSAAANTISRSSILDLIHSVNKAYRKGERVKLMFNDDVHKQIMKLSIGSADDRPLWVPSMRDGSPATIEGYQYCINEDMPGNDAVGNKYMAFGDWSKYLIRIVRDFNIRRTDERHIEEFVVAFYGFARMDGKLINADAIKTLAAS